MSSWKNHDTYSVWHSLRSIFITSKGLRVFCYKNNENYPCSKYKVRFKKQKIMLKLYVYMHFHIYIYTYIYMYACVHSWLCVYQKWSKHFLTLWILREKLVRERGAGSRDFISKLFGILTTMARQTYYRGL
jgi:hypothetical protein